jgi:basic amino acid/polyamine antiporter, APA family
MEPAPTNSGNPAAAETQPQLLRALGVWETSSIVIGIMIGTAIFIVPAEITREVGTPGAALAVWIFGGVLSLLGALSFAELAAMLPQAGGQYVYLREAYGPLVSFLCGWQFLLASQTAGISALAVAFAVYLNQFIPLTPWEQKGAAAASIVLLTIINYLGVKEGGRVQSLLTGIKVAAIAALIVLGYVLVRGLPPAGAAITPPTGRHFVSAFGVALVSAFWAYEGWNACTFAAGEVKRPERTLPLALIVGTITVVLFYAGLNLVYYHTLSLSAIVHSSAVGADASVRIFGATGALVVSLLIIISTLSSLNGSILAAPRVYYAMAKDGAFFRWCACVHPRFRTPHLALLLQAGWAIVLVAWGTYEQLFTYVVFAAWIFYALTAFAVIILRRKLPKLKRPYRVWGYPLVPLGFVLGSVWFLLNMLAETPRESGIGTLMVLVGIPVYLIWKRKSGAARRTRDA